MIFVDPHRDGCHVFHHGVLYSIKGNVEDCCTRIVEQFCKADTEDIVVDYRGVGNAYMYWFDTNCILVTPVKYTSL